VPTDPDGPGWLRAQVKAYCMVPRPDAPATCAEQIYATAGGATGRHLGAIVAPLLVHDLPVTIWWPGEPPFDTLLARDLIGMADRLVVDGSSWAGDGLDRLRAIASLGGGSLAVSDFALMRQARWREAVASVFDRPEFLPYLRSMRRVSVTYGTHGGPDTEARTNIVKPIYHVAWLASRLNLRVARPLERTGRAGVARHPIPGAGLESGRGMRALLEWERGAEVEVVIRPVLSEMPAGTTLRVEILAERRGAELRAEVTAEAETVHVRVWEDGVEALERAFTAPRRTDVDLLAEAIEAGGHDRVAEQATSMAAALVGPPVGRAGANAGDEPRGGAAETAGDASGDGRS
jgi:glucose-6-phosphate dehydrogenase assembly protein OpcA